MSKKLEFELVPDGCWGYNLRAILSKAQWSFIRKDAIERSNNKCSACGKKAKRLEAHEKWQYDIEKGIVKLIDVVALCSDCHKTVHIGRTQLVGNFDKACEHYQKVNNCSYVQMRKDLGEANALQIERNTVSEWVLDLSWLKRFVKE